MSVFAPIDTALYERCKYLEWEAVVLRQKHQEQGAELARLREQIEALTKGATQSIV